VQGEDVLPQFGRHTGISEAYKENVTIHCRESQGNVTKEDKGSGDMYLFSRGNEFSVGEDSVEGLTVSLAGPLSRSEKIMGKCVGCHRVAETHLIYHTQGITESDTTIVMRVGFKSSRFMDRFEEI
jgi:hypothetical protein